jgi:acyl dehydratase
MAELKWYFEDFEPGRVILAGSRTLCEDEIVAFAMHFDPQPFHVNRAAAAESHFGGIIASGWHTCSIMMRLVVDGFLSEAASMGSPGVDEIRWLAPVRPGDTLTVTTTVLDARPSSSKPDRGVVHTMWEAKNQHGDTVATVKGMGMFMRRPVQHQAMH